MQVRKSNPISLRKQGSLGGSAGLQACMDPGISTMASEYCLSISGPLSHCVTFFSGRLAPPGGRASHCHHPTTCFREKSNNASS